MKVGTKVRLDVTGVVTEVDENLGMATFSVGPERFWAKIDLLEVVEDIRPGDVVLDSDGYVYKRSSDNKHWFEMGSGEVCPDHEALRPLTLLVRDGKKV